MVPEDAGRRLHIGGKVRLTGWEVLNVLPGPWVDHVGNAKDLARFASGCFTEVYASHVLEHFDYCEEANAALAEWFRVLTPGGRLCVSVPDLDTLARLLLDQETMTLEDRYFVMRMMFGGHVDRYDYHQAGFNEAILTAFLQGAGFTDLARVEAFGWFDDTSDMRFKGVAISLNMTARKP